MTWRQLEGKELLNSYLGYDQLTHIVVNWAQQHHDFVRLSSIATTHGGRDVWMLEVGRDLDWPRPAILIDGNMHSAELLGSNVALNVARTLIDLHSGRSKHTKAPMDRVHEAAAECLYYIVPRISPDGAEDVLNTGRISRSAPRQRLSHDGPPRWVRSDIDGDGRIRQLRICHPAGELVQHPKHSHVLAPRTLLDDGPFYKVFPEGYIEGFDGNYVPAPHTLSDNDTDFNRNFPFDWSADDDGAGAFPGWEPETRAIIEFATRSPHIFAWLNLHTFGGVMIRPPFSGLKQDLERDDRLVYDHIAKLAEMYTGMSTVSAFEDMTPMPTQPMRGTLASWAYWERGCFAWAVELWDLFGAIGLEKRKPFFRNYAIQGRQEIDLFVEWDMKANGGRVFNHWHAFSHKQLGEVEIGGIDPVCGLLNPPEEMIEPICEQFSSLALTLASLAPRLKTTIATRSASPSLTEVKLKTVNTGYLSTFITAASRQRMWNQGVKAIMRTYGCTMISGRPIIDLGHVRGWGRGAEEEGNGPFFQKSQGVDDINLEWIVEGSGDLEIEIGSPRLGWRTHTVHVGT